VDGLIRIDFTTNTQTSLIERNKPYNFMCLATAIRSLWRSFIDYRLALILRSIDRLTVVSAIKLLIRIFTHPSQASRPVIAFTL